MKKFLILALIFIIFNNCSVFAKNLKVEALSDFSTANPPKEWKVKVVEGFTAKPGYEVVPGSIITGEISDVTTPKRLKRNASFKFIPISFYDAKTGETFNIDKELVGKYNSISDIKAVNVIAKGAVTAGNYFISNTIGPGIALVAGAAKNKEGNRAKSAIISVYENSLLSYASKGRELEISQGQHFIMKFKMLGDEDTDEDSDLPDKSIPGE